MASQGPRFPGTTASLANAGTSENAEAWVTPGNIGADDGSTSSITAATYDSPDISQLLVASNFGFTIPTDATILGITVEVDRNNAAGAASDNRVQLAKGTTFASLVGTNQADTALDWPASLTVKSYGGAADLWGATWTPAELNASSFAVMLSAQADAANTDVAVDFIRVTVAYLEPPVWKDGFETGDLSRWDSVVQGDGSAVASTAAARVGLYGAAIDEPSSAAGGTYARHNVTATDRIRVAGSFRSATEGAAGNNNACLRVFAGGVRIVDVYRQNATSGQLWLRTRKNDGTFAFTNTGELRGLDVWFRFDVLIEYGGVGAVSRVRVKVDGATVIDAATFDLDSGAFDMVQIGAEHPTQYVDLDVDDVLVDRAPTPYGEPALTGGGVVTSSSSGSRSSSPIVTGGGVVTLVGQAETGGESHSGTVTTTGGGVVALVGSSAESHSGTVTTTGSGVVTSSSSGSRSSAPIVTGGGVVTSSSSGARSRTVTTTGGGVVTLVAGELLEERSGTVSVSGAGRVTFTIYGEGAITLTGCEIAGVRWDVQGDVGEIPLILDRDLLDVEGRSELFPQAEADQTSLGDMLLRASWRWGAGQALGPLTVETAGSATITLIDTERKLDTTNPDAWWLLTFRLGLPLRILADGLPAFTGVVDSWTHDVARQTSTIVLIDAIGEAALVPVAETTVGLPAAPMSVTPRDLAEVAIDSAGWPNSRREYLNTTTVGHSSGDPPIPDTGSLLGRLQELAYFELATLSASRAGKLRWRSNLGPQAIPAPTAIVNCGGVILSSLEAGQASWRVRNRVRISGTPGSAEWFGDVVTFAPDDVGASTVPRLVTTSVDSLPIGGVAFPSGREAASSSFVMLNAGLVAQAATAYELELWRADTRATVWTSAGAIAIPYAGSLGVAYGGPALVAGVPYEWRYRLTLSGGGTTQWMGARFTTGTRPLSSPTFYREWADRILDELADPLPLVELGTLAPVGAEVGPIIRAERDDRWLVVHDHVDPPITATVKVLGMSCTLTPTGVEADAVTETEAIA